MSARKLIPVLVVVGLAALGAYALLRRKVDLLLVNPSAVAVKVTVNGAPYDVPAAGQVLVAGVSPDLQLQADGVTLAADAGAGAAPSKTWVWSVAPVTTWWTVNKGYGDLIGAAPASTAFVPSSSPVFALPDDYGQLVDAPLPENASVKKGVSGTVLRALWSEAYVERTAPRRVMLVVHNDSPRELRIEQEGATLAALPADAVMHVPDLPSGLVKLRAVVVEPEGKDGQVYTLEADLQAAPPLSPTRVHVWDVVGSSRFWVVSRRYGPDPDAEGAPPPPTRFEVPAGAATTFFTLPDGFFHELDAPFPETWPRQELLKFLWCDDYLKKQQRARRGALVVPGEDDLQRRLENEVTKRGRRAPAPPGAPGAEPAPFPPVQEGEGD